MREKPDEQDLKNKSEIENISLEQGGKITPVTTPEDQVSQTASVRVTEAHISLAIKTVFIGIMISAGLIVFGSLLIVKTNEVTTETTLETTYNKDKEITQTKETTKTTKTTISSNKNEINIFIIAFSFILMTLCTATAVGSLNPQIVLAIIEKIPNINKNQLF